MPSGRFGRGRPPDPGGPDAGPDERLLGPSPWAGSPKRRPGVATYAASMARSAAGTVDEYLAELPDDRAEVVQAVRGVVVAHLPAGYVETMNWGMISYELPLSRYPDTFNGHPLGLAALAAQARYYSLYLYGCYGDDEVRARFVADSAASGRPVDMGKSCVRFRSLEAIDLDAVGRAVAATPPARLIELSERARA